MTSEHRFEAELAQLLWRALAELGFAVHAAHFGTHQQPDLDASFDGHRFAIEMKAAGRNRTEVLHGLMAAALVQARRHASSIEHAAPLPIVAVSNLSDRAVATVAEFMARETSGVAWGLLDRSGQLQLHGVPGIEPARVVRQRAQPRVPSQHELDPFTDLGQWMAKVLVAERLPAKLLSAPRGKLSRARHLAFAANVSEPTAARWTKLLREQGFLDDSSGQLRIVRAREFFERWRRTSGARPRREVAARFSLPSNKPDQQLRQALGKFAFEETVPFNPDEPALYDGAIRWKRGPRACLALFEASAALDFAFVFGAPVHMYLESIDDESLRRFGLERAPADRAHVRVIEPAWPESLFRGAVMRRTRDGLDLPTSDIVQTWLDVADHPVRGREQADEIEREVLAKWIFGETSGGARS